MTAVDTIDLNAAPDFILRDGGELIVHTIACGGGGRHDAAWYPRYRSPHPHRVRRH